MSDRPAERTEHKWVYYYWDQLMQGAMLAFLLGVFILGTSAVISFEVAVLNMLLVTGTAAINGYSQ